jgi:hypothetical protein
MIFDAGRAPFKAQSLRLGGWQMLPRPEECEKSWEFKPRSWKEMAQD